MQSLQPTPQDYTLLWEEFPVVYERLKVIVLLRMVAEKDARIQELQTTKPPDGVAVGVVNGS